MMFSGSISLPLWVVRWRAFLTCNAITALLWWMWQIICLLIKTSILARIPAILVIHYIGSKWYRNYQPLNIESSIWVLDWQWGYTYFTATLRMLHAMGNKHEDPIQITDWQDLLRRTYQITEEIVKLSKLSVHDEINLNGAALIQQIVRQCSSIWLYEIIKYHW